MNNKIIVTIYYNHLVLNVIHGKDDTMYFYRINFDGWRKLMTEKAVFKREYDIDEEIWQTA